jgi:hypothetical protein
MTSLGKQWFVAMGFEELQLNITALISQDALNALMTVVIPHNPEPRISGIWWNFAWFVCDTIVTASPTELLPSLRVYVDMVGALAAAHRPLLIESSITPEQRSHRIFIGPLPLLLPRVSSACAAFSQRPASMISIHSSQLKQFTFLIACESL